MQITRCDICGAEEIGYLTNSFERWARLMSRTDQAGWRQMDFCRECLGDRLWDEDLRIYLYHEILRLEALGGKDEVRKNVTRLRHPMRVRGEWQCP